MKYIYLPNSTNLKDDLEANIHLKTTFTGFMEKRHKGNLAMQLFIDI